MTEKIADDFERCRLPLADDVLDFHSGGRTLDFVPAPTSVVDLETTRHSSARPQAQAGGAHGYALYLSVLSAFDMGWRELNVGAWLTKLQGRGDAPRSCGWTRTVSGIQSLISLYLIAMWVPTPLARPL